MVIILIYNNKLTRSIPKSKQFFFYKFKKIRTNNSKLINSCILNEYNT